MALRWPHSVRPGIPRHGYSLLMMALLASVVFLYAAAPARAAGAIYCVDLAGGATTAPCANVVAYTDIEDAIAVASSGDEIRIASGTYTGDSTNVILIYKQSMLALRGGYTSSDWQTPSNKPTIIDGQLERSVIRVSGASSVTLERLTITRGYNYSGVGGGINAILDDTQTLTLIDTIVSDNHASTSGGGIWVVGGSVVLNRVELTNNAAMKDGGGFFWQRSLADYGSIKDNTSGRDVSDAQTHNISVTDSQITGNTATNGDGGGIYVVSPLDGTLEMARTSLRENKAGGRGGAMYLANAGQTQLSWSLLADNQAATGDALVVEPHTASQVGLANVTIARSSVSSHAAIVLGISEPAPAIELTLRNTVVTSHTVGIARQSTASILGDYNAFSGVATHQTVGGSGVVLPFTHLITTDPQFIAPSSGDFHLRGTSPLRDAADPSLSYTGQQDLDGAAVPVGDRVDLGAYEWFPYRMLLPLSLR